MAWSAQSILNYCRSLTPSNSRPHTPPSSGKANVRSTKIPPPAASSGLSSPPKQNNYSQLLSSTNNEWEDDDDDDDEDDNVTGYSYDDGMEEDEFGLPSISSMKRDAKRRPPAKQFNDPGGGIGSDMNGGFYSLDPPRPPGRARANSSDIALERGPPGYPAAKGGDRKILRPQYKDILRGELWASGGGDSTNVFRSGQFPSSHQTFTCPCQCYSKRKRSSNDSNNPYQQV